MSYLKFEIQPADPSKKTRKWFVLGGNGDKIGEVLWYAHWRRYTYAPGGPQVLDATCLLELGDFCATETGKRIAQRKADKESDEDEQTD